MRPINLLPPYIYDKQKKGQLAAVWGVAVLAVAGGFIYWLGLVNKDMEAAVAEKTEAEGYQQKYNSLNSQIQAENTKIAQIKQKQDFIANAQKYNDSWRDVYMMMRDVTSPKIILRSMAIDPQTRSAVTFNGAARTEMDIVRWWMALRNDTTRFQSVRMELPPHPYSPGGGAAAGGGLGGSARGRFGAMGGGAPGSGAPGSGGGGGPMIASTSAAGGGGFSGGPGGGGRPAGSMMPGAGGSPFSGSMMPGMGGGGRFGGSGGAQAATTELLEGRPVINFAGVAILNTPLAGGLPTPAWSPGGGGGATGGAGASFGGSMMPGAGMPGMGGFSGGPGGAGRPQMGGMTNPGGGGGGSSMRTAD